MVYEKIGGKKFSACIKKVDFIILIILVWEVFASWIYPFFEPRSAMFFPPFSAVARELWGLIVSGLLLRHILASVTRVLIGFSLASICGISLAFVFSLSDFANQQLKLICRVFKSVPPVAWIPLSLLWFGITENQQYFIIFIGVIFPVLFNTLEGINAIPERFRQLAKTLGSGRFSTFRQVILPASLPKIMFGLRSGLGYAWFIIVAAEFVSASSGLGYLILEGRNMIITTRIFAGMLTIGMVNLAFYYLLTKLENWISPWYKLSLID